MGEPQVIRCPRCSKGFMDRHAGCDSARCARLECRTCRFVCDVSNGRTAAMPDRERTEAEARTVTREVAKPYKAAMAARWRGR
jgi:hypothetical protein